MSDDLEPACISVIRFASRLLSNLLRQAVYFPHSSYCPGQIRRSADLLKRWGNATVSELERWRNRAQLSL
jgi:hypothetical protein